MSEDGRKFDLGASARTAFEDAQPVLGFMSLIVAFSLFLPIIEANYLVALAVGAFWSCAFALLMGYMVWRDHRTWRRVGQRFEYERAAARAGVRLGEVDVSGVARVRHALRAVAEPALGAAAVVGALGAVTMLWGNATSGLQITVFGFGFIGLLTLLFTLYDASREEGFSHDAARAEAAYREAVREGADLDGALSPHVEAGEGGELSVAAQGGGVALHEEVALDLDGQASAPARDEVDLLRPEERKRR